jgi:hypothetical protein
MNTLVSSYTTGSYRGYIPVAKRGLESEVKPVPGNLDGLRGNQRKAMRRFIDCGATRYTTKSYQGVPGKGYSNQYCYTVYTGYTEE